MIDKIREYIDHPVQLEKLYRSDIKGFGKSFIEIYPEIASAPLAPYWKARIDYDSASSSWSLIKMPELLYVVICCLFSGLLIKLPVILGMDQHSSLFYEKNAGLIAFLGLSLFAYLSKAKINAGEWFVVVIIFALSGLYVNFLPIDPSSQSVTLVYIHVPMMLWCLYGLIFMEFNFKNLGQRMDFIRHNGDLAILGAIIAISGGILTGVTLGLFSAIGLKIEQFYFDYIVLVGMVSAPIVATYIIGIQAGMANKIAPIIAGIFSPLVLITLVVYLCSIIITGKDPYNDRDFLMVFNLMLLGVMAIIVFSISGTSNNKKQRFNEMTLWILSIVTLLVDLVAVSAILYRLGEYGFTPNRVAILGSNLLILGNLIWIMMDLFKVNFRKRDIHLVETTIARYLPFYAAWTVFIVFLLPIIFSMK